MHKHTDQSVTPEFEEIGKVVDLIDIAGKLPASTVVVAGGHRVEDLRLVESARDHGIVDRIILVGSKDRIAKSVTEVGIEIDPEDIVPADKDEQIAKATVELIRNGKADIVLKGGISTPVINRHMLPLAIRSTVSLATVFDAACIAGGRPMVLTDPGVTTVCNFGRVRDLARNAVDVAQTVMGIEKPRVAILSANEKQIPSLPSTWIGLEMARRSWPDAVVCGPLSFDLATDPESVSVKGLPDLPNAAEVAGHADVLVCPGIDTANALYKTISAMNKYGEASLASITVGFPVPYIILSRSDSVETRLVSIALSAVYTQRARKQRRPQPAKPTATAPYRIVVVDPDRTPMEAAFYEDDRCLHQADVFHDVSSSGRNGDVEQLALLVCGLLDQWGEAKVDSVAVASGFASDPPEVSSAGISDTGERGGSLGPPVAEAVALKLGARALVVSPRVTSRYAPEAKLSGYEPIVRGGGLNALTVSAAAERAAADIGLPLSQVNLVIAHLDDVITTAAVRGGTI
ncbi:MAG: phosphate acyltransferase, partial [Chloroflexota bacterium]